MSAVVLTRAKRETRWNAVPLTWWPGTANGKRTATAVCDKGHAASLDDHTIQPDGTVQPSLVCPIEDCGWHVMARLEGWSSVA